eukprot:gene13240-9085_t
MGSERMKVIQLIQPKKENTPAADSGVKWSAAITIGPIKFTPSLLVCFLVLFYKTFPVSFIAFISFM